MNACRIHWCGIWLDAIMLRYLFRIRSQATSAEISPNERRNQIGHYRPRPGKQSRRRQSTGLPRFDDPTPNIGCFGQIAKKARSRRKRCLLRTERDADNIFPRRHGLRPRRWPPLSSLPVRLGSYRWILIGFCKGRRSHSYDRRCVCTRTALLQRSGQPLRRFNYLL